MDRREFAMFDNIEKRFADLKPAVDFCSLRVVSQRHERVIVRQDVLEPVLNVRDVGAMVTVLDGSSKRATGMGYGS